MMAANGHAGLPPVITRPAAAPPGPPSPGSSSGGSDRQVAQQEAQQLSAAIDQAHDPQLQAVLSAALTALHKYLAMDQKEQHQAMAGKLSPRLMAQGAQR